MSPALAGERTRRRSWLLLICGVLNSGRSVRKGLRALITKALDALEAELNKPDSPVRWKVTLEVIALSPPKCAELGPTDPKQIVQKIVETQRMSAHSPLEDLLNSKKGLPPFEQHVAQTWKELEELSRERDDES